MHLKTIHLLIFITFAFAAKTESDDIINLDPNHNLKYVFEIVRHGARAPIVNDTLRFGTTVMPGELTPIGM